MPRWSRRCLRPLRSIALRPSRLIGGMVGWDGFWWVVGIAAVLAIGGLLSWRYWDALADDKESLSTTIRNVGLVVGGIIAILLAVWRSIVAERQADTAQQSLLNERYERGAEMLGSDVLSVRLGGIYALQRLAQEHPEEYHLQIMRLMCAFVRYPTEDQSFLDKQSTDEPTPLIRPDIDAAMAAFVNRDEQRLDIESEAHFTVDLQTAKLRGAHYAHANLSGARLHRADMSKAELPNAHMSGSDLTCANLSEANLSRADLSYADLDDAELPNATLIRTLRGAIMTGATLTGANLVDANDLGLADLTGRTGGVSGMRDYLVRRARRRNNLSRARLIGTHTTDLSGSRLIGTNLSGARLDDAECHPHTHNHDRGNSDWSEPCRRQGTDLTGANIAHANLSGASLRGGAELSGANLSTYDLSGNSEPWHTAWPATGLTQAQLDEACADPDNPPRLDGVLDAETGKLLVWRGKPVESPSA